MFKDQVKIIQELTDILSDDIKKYYGENPNVLELVGLMMGMLQFIQWDKKDNPEEFKKHLQTLFNNEVKLHKIYSAKE